MSVSRFNGKVALVTGGTSGIGRAAAAAFAKEGATVIVSGRREEEGGETVRLVQQAGAEGRFVRCDVSKAAEVVAMIRQVEEAYGRLDFAFNNAGVAPKNAPLAEQGEEEFDQTVAINLKGVWLSMKYENLPLRPRSKRRERTTEFIHSPDRPKSSSAHSPPGASRAA